jgi:D-serine deaminase-like pyridoxal phosphate-dependent protein
VDVLVKVDVGFHRCGIDPDPRTAVAFVKAVAALPGVNFRGLLSHAGHAYHAASEKDLQAIAEYEARSLHAIAIGAREEGVQVDELSAGATPTARYSLQQDWITEYRAGNYVYFDRTQVGLRAATLEDCALTVLATVVSHPTPRRYVLDAGIKALAGEDYGWGTYGRLLEHPDVVLTRATEEHGVIELPDDVADPRLRVGDVVRIVPDHACGTANMQDVLVAVDGERVVDVWPVIARGRVR